ncbi:MAG TPA: hypothetical protein VJ183_07435 [Chloroflexia bacterium]|nr:hypothetical protein [Chloroflexia bacterium]
MVKKTAKGAKTASQRAREEQWRRRAAAQGGLPAASTGTVERDDSGDGDGTEATYTPRSGVARSTASTSSARYGAAARSRTGSSMGAATPRRQFQAARPGRMRMAANTLSLDEEMHYVRSDIRRLIILTAICLAVLIALSFVIR